MFKFTKAFWIPLGVGAGTLATGVGTVAGIILPKSLKARNALGNWISDGGKANSLKGKNKINYVALGDSETAGYIGFLEEEYLSYADFLAGSLKNADKLGKYSNFASSGERLADVKKNLFENANKIRELRDADLITLTLGANDVLAYMKILNIPFGQAVDLFGDQDKIEKISKENVLVKYDENQKKYLIQKSSDVFSLPEIKSAIEQAEKKLSDIKTQTPNSRDDIKNAETELINLKNIIATTVTNKIKDSEDELNTLKSYENNKAAEHRIEIFGNNPKLGISKKDSAELFIGTVDKLSKILTGTPQAFLNIDKDWYPKIFDLITREYVTLIRDLHEVAPNAQIRVLGHAFPFGLLPKTIIENSKKSLDGDSIKDGFEKMLKAIEDGAEKNLDGTSAFVKFQNINDFPGFKDKLKPLKPLVNLEDENAFRAWITDNPMPNITDIHPSVYGHDLIAEDLYKDVAMEMGNIPNIEKTTQHSNDKSNPLWNRKDELKLLNNPKELTEFYASTKTFYNLVTAGDTLSEQKDLFPIIKNLLNYLKKPTIDGNLPEWEKIMQEVFGDELFQTFDKVRLASDNSNFDEAEKIMKDVPENVQLFLAFFDKILGIFNFVKNFHEQLNDGINSGDVSNEEQWTLAQVGIAKLFQSINYIQAILSQIPQTTT